MLEKCGSLDVLVSLRTILPVAASATNRSIENTLRPERNAIHLPSGLIAGPTLSSLPSSSPAPMMRFPISLGGIAAASIGRYAARIDSCHASESSCVVTPRIL